MKYHEARNLVSEDTAMTQAGHDEFWRGTEEDREPWITAVQTGRMEACEAASAISRLASQV